MGSVADQKYARDNHTRPPEAQNLPGWKAAKLCLPRVRLSQEHSGSHHRAAYQDFATINHQKFSFGCSIGLARLRKRVQSANHFPGAKV